MSNTYTTHPVHVMYQGVKGDYLADLAEPLPALGCARIEGGLGAPVFTLSTDTVRSGGDAFGEKRMVVRPVAGVSVISR